jgi:hypothetical protein
VKIFGKHIQTLTYTQNIQRILRIKKIRKQMPEVKTSKKLLTIHNEEHMHMLSKHKRRCSTPLPIGERQNKPSVILPHIRIGKN